MVADEAWVVNDVRSALADSRYSITHTDEPRGLADQLATTPADVVLVDMQIGSMGGMAVTRSIRETSRGGRAAPPVILMLDRDADAFLAGRSGAATWIRKPFGSSDLRRAIDGVLTADVP